MPASDLLDFDSAFEVVSASVMEDMSWKLRRMLDGRRGLLPRDAYDIGLCYGTLRNHVPLLAHLMTLSAVQYNHPVLTRTNGGTLQTRSVIDNEAVHNLLQQQMGYDAPHNRPICFLPPISENQVAQHLALADENTRALVNDITAHVLNEQPLRDVCLSPARHGHKHRRSLEEWVQESVEQGEHLTPIMFDETLLTTPRRCADDDRHRSRWVFDCGYR